MAIRGMIAVVVKVATAFVVVALTAGGFRIWIHVCQQGDRRQEICYEKQSQSGKNNSSTDIALQEIDAAGFSALDQSRHASSHRLSPSNSSRRMYYFTYCYFGFCLYCQNHLKARTKTEEKVMQLRVVVEASASTSVSLRNHQTISLPNNCAHAHLQKL